METVTVTKEKLKEAIWQAYYHMELEELGKALFFATIDGNDHEVIKVTADNLFKRLQ